ncbi:ATPase domain-containing protein [Duganella qianjiadongensis]|uniref:non-specific serine/threonine protein kinase n=1 Tax=Duganella qianjiadongensis TaxID=2692176 RepID=A0ABW9VFL0_9BURK|nr:ATPase domain-containing protein [Duganella qianjiadongensis]MYM38399.1 AAA family ATPase [Duganella qianjiadongensis]
MRNSFRIKRLVTAIPGLDTVLGGGFPEYSFNLLAGSPGSGKTTLAHQIMFALASPQRSAIYFTALGEPPLKTLRYQQQFSFFDPHQVNRSIKFINLAPELLSGDHVQLLNYISEQVQRFGPALVFIDSFRSILRASSDLQHNSRRLQQFIQQLGVQMTSWQATTFLIGEYEAPQVESSTIFTIADGILWLSQLNHRDTLIRKIQIIKMRGQAQSLGKHHFRISDDGITIYPRAVLDHTLPALPIGEAGRLSSGIAALDTMLGGGIPRGYAVLVVGPSGAGKSICASQFLHAGIEAGEPGVIASFEKGPEQLLNRRLHQMVASGQVGLIDTFRLDLSLDEILHNLLSRIQQMQARRVVIDSLSGCELALAGQLRADFRENLSRLISILTSRGLTVLMTAELEDRYGSLSFNVDGNAIMADIIIMQRYIELNGALQRVIAVIKVRGSDHSKALHFYQVEQEQLVIGAALSDYRGILTGQPAAATGQNS